MASVSSMRNASIEAANPMIGSGMTSLSFLPLESFVEREANCSPLVVAGGPGQRNGRVPISFPLCGGSSPMR
jgi:hypothetical protein